MLECSDFKVYVQGAPTHLGVGISIPSTGAVRRSPVASIFLLVVFGGLYRGSTERRSRAGNANSIQSAVLISINGGSSLNLREDNMMDDVRYAVWLFSQLSPEDQEFILIFTKMYLEHTQSRGNKL